MIIKHLRPAAAASLMVLSLSGLSLPQDVSAGSGKSTLEQGKALAFSRKKGNCLACHVIDDGDSPGNIAPPLMAMKQRYPDRAKLRAQIWDATAANPDTPMPPFGKHRILSERELDLVVDYIWSL